MPPVTVKVDEDSFYPKNITIVQGQTILFQLDNVAPHGPQRSEIEQIMCGSVHGNHLPVEGGFVSQNFLDSKEWSLTFQRVGEYKFGWKELPPMTVKVEQRPVTQIEISRNGFSTNIMRLYVGDKICWQFASKSLTVKEVSFCDYHKGFKDTDIKFSYDTVLENEFELRKSGLKFYSIDDVTGSGSFCVFQIIDRPSNIDVSLTPGGFSKHLIELNRGDRLWCSWSGWKGDFGFPSIEIRCIKSLDGKCGDKVFESSTVRSRGLLSHLFSQSGLFELREASLSFFSIIKVLPKNKEHSISITEESFVPSIGSGVAGDVIWFASETLPSEDVAKVSVIKNVHLGRKRSFTCSSDCSPTDANQKQVIDSLGLKSFCFESPGLVSLKLSRDEDETDDNKTCHLIIYPQTNHHVIDMTLIPENGKLYQSTENDIAWLAFHGITGRQTKFHQVQLDGQKLLRSLINLPRSSTDEHSFTMIALEQTGIKHYAGFIADIRVTPIVTFVISPRKKIHKVRVTPQSLSPDPVFTNVGDIVLWIWPKDSLSSLTKLDVISETTRKASETYTARRCICRCFKKEGVSHFSCGYAGVKKLLDSSPMLPESVWCSVLCDPKKIPNALELKSNGFSEQMLYMCQNETLLIDCSSINVYIQNTKWSLSKYEMSKNDSIDLTPVFQDSFVLIQISNIGRYNLHVKFEDFNFELPIISVPSGQVLMRPILHEASNVANVEEGHVIQLVPSANNIEHIILYTLDGSVPSPLSTSTKVLDPRSDVRLTGAGLMFVRAVAIGDTALPSHVTTSRRFWVMENDETMSAIFSPPDTSYDDQTFAEDNTPLCPVILVAFIAENVIRISWQTLKKIQQKKISGFMLCIDDVLRGPLYDSNCSSIIVSGLTAGRGYTIALCLIEQINGLAIKSNELLITCPTVSSLNGPIISLEALKEENEASVLWMTNYHPHFNITAFHVLLNGNELGKIKSSNEVGYCSVLLSGLDQGCLHEVVVKAEVEGDSKVFPSNKLEFTLPIQLNNHKDNEVNIFHQTIARSSATNEDLINPSNVNETQEILFFSQTNGEGPLNAFIMYQQISFENNLTSLAYKLVNEAVADAFYDITAEDLVRNVLDDVAEENKNGKCLEHDKPIASKSQLDGDRIAEDFVERLIAEVFDELEIENRNHINATNAQDNISLSEMAPKLPISEKDLDLTASNLVSSALNDAVEELRDETADYLAKFTITSALKELENIADKRDNTTFEKTQNSETAVDEQSYGETTEGTCNISDYSTSSENKPIINNSNLKQNRWISAQNYQTDTLSDVGINIQACSKNKIIINWKGKANVIQTKIKPVYHVFILGLKFDDKVNSNTCYSFENSPLPESWPPSDDNTAQNVCMQHAWETTKCAIEVSGLKPRYTYSIWLVVRNQNNGESISTGRVLYTMPGPPSAPDVCVTELIDKGALLSWQSCTSYGEALVSGYVVYLNDEKYGNTLSSGETSVVISGLEPSTTNKITVVALSQGKGDIKSKPSETLVIGCPLQLIRVDSLVQVNIEELGAILLSWTIPNELWEQLETLKQDATWLLQEDDVSFQIIVNGIVMGNHSLCEGEETALFKLTGCKPGILHTISIRTYIKPSNILTNDTYHFTNDENNNKDNKTLDNCSEENSIDPQSSRNALLYCGCSSEISNELIVAPISPPSSPRLLIKQMDRHGIEVTWDHPHVFGFAKLSGYYLFVNGEIHGNRLPYDAISTRITDLTPGKDYILSITAITDHRIGTISAKGETSHEKSKQAKSVPHASPLILDSLSAYSNCSIADYPNCRTGPPLVIYYKDLMYPLKDVTVIDVSGASAKILWKVNKKISHGIVNNVYVTPMSYVVSLWREHDELKLIKEKETSGMNVILSNLEPGIQYSLSVKSRTPHLNDKDMANTRQHFVCWEESEVISFVTKQPPLPPTDFNGTSQSKESIYLRWNSFEERGITVLKFAVQCIAKVSASQTNGSRHVYEHQMTAIPSDRQHITIHGLHEKVEYLCTLYLITMHSDKANLDALSEGDVVNDRWTPCVSTVVTTSSYDAPSCLDVTHVDSHHIRLQWVPGISYGSFDVLYHRVCHQQISINGSDSNTIISNGYIEVSKNVNEATIKDLIPGQKYSVFLKAFVGLTNSNGYDKKEHDESEESVSSSNLCIWTRSPPSRPALVVYSVSSDAIQLSWGKPGALLNEQPISSLIRRSLLGYKLHVNDEDFCLLRPSELSFQLPNPRYNVPYKFQLEVVTCSDEQLKHHSADWQRLVASCRSFASPSFSKHEEVGDIDFSLSNPITIQLNKSNDQPCFTSIEASFVKKSIDRNMLMQHHYGNINVKWQISSQHDFDIDHYNITWWNIDEPNLKNEAILREANTRKFDLTDIEKRFVYCVQVSAVMNNEDEEIITSPIISCQVPGAPKSPIVHLKSVTRNSFTIEWNEPETYGNVRIGGYHVYLNGSKLGKILPVTSRSCTVPCRLGRSYKVTMTTLSTDLYYTESEQSNELSINTLNEISTSGKKDHESYPVIDVSATNVSDTSIDIEWKEHDIGDGEAVEYYIIHYSSVAVPTPMKITVLGGQRKYSIKRCRPGTSYFINLSAYDKRKKLLARGVNQLTAQTSAQIETPVLETRECIASRIVIGWKKPTEFGNAHLTGYLLQLDDREYAEIEKEDTSYEFSFCRPGNSYKFELIALCSKSSHNSRSSEPLFIVCPGAGRAILTRVQTSNADSIKVAWQKPALYGNAKVKHYTIAYCRSKPGDISLRGEQILNDPTVVKQGPHPPFAKVDVIANLDTYSMYHIVLQIDFTPDDCPSIYSQPIRTKPAIPPNPPFISSDVLDFEKRKAKDEKLAMLMTSRDHCCREVNLLRSRNHVDVSEKQINQLLILVAKIDNEIRTVLKALHQLTGFVRVSISWSFPGHDGDAVARGYRVLCDGEPYGTVLPIDCDETTVQVLADGKQHRLSMITVTDHPVGSSNPSNILEISTKDFLPSTMFCYHDVHKKGTSWPDRGCCVYKESFAHEHNAKWNMPNKGMTNIGVTNEGYPLLAKGLDLIDDQVKSIINPSSKFGIVLFYAHWCHASIVALKRIEKLSQQEKELDFITCCTHGSENTSVHRLRMLDRLKEIGFDDRPNIRHICTCQRCDDNEVMKRSISNDRKSNITTADLCDVIGVPTIMIINLKGEIAWQGRICAANFTSFRVSLHHFLNLIRVGECCEFACPQCTANESCANYMQTIQHSNFSDSIPLTNGNSHHTRKVLRQNLFPEISPNRLKKKPWKLNGNTLGTFPKPLTKTLDDTTSINTPSRVKDSTISSNNRRRQPLVNGDARSKSRSLQNGDFPTISPHPPKQKKKEAPSSSSSFKRSYSAPNRNKTAAK